MLFGRKLSTALVVSVMAIAFAASPVAASYVIYEEGQRGEWQTYDNPGLICIYDKDTAQLTKIKVRPPTYMYGSHDQMTWVGWRFQVREPVEFEAGPLVHKSGTQKRLASKTVVAEDFKWGLWYAPSDLNPDGYYVRVHGLWFAPGSKTTREGLSIHGYLSSRHKMGTASYGTSYCSASY